MSEIDWLNPTAQMFEGRDAGRNDRQTEIDNLTTELNEVLDELSECQLKAAALQRHLNDAEECIGDIYSGGENVNERTATYYRDYPEPDKAVIMEKHGLGPEDMDGQPDINHPD